MIYYSFCYWTELNWSQFNFSIDYHHQLKVTNSWSLQYLIWKIKWKKEPIFITKNVNAYIVFHFNLVKIFFLHSELNSIIVKIFNNFFIILLIVSGCYFEKLMCLRSNHQKHFVSFFFIWITPFWGLFKSTGHFI